MGDPTETKAPDSGHTPDLPSGMKSRAGGWLQRFPAWLKSCFTYLDHCARGCPLRELDWKPVPITFALELRAQASGIHKLREAIRAKCACGETWTHYTGDAEQKTT